MDTPLLATKLLVPPARPGLVPRPYLVERLNAALNYAFVLVSAPAGFGKTTLVSEWVRTGQPRVRSVWVSLDEGDNDAVRFWDYFIAALQTVQPWCGGKILPWLHSSEPPSAKPMLTALINDLYRVNGELVVVLDDYHLVDSQPIHDGIAYLIERLPPQAHLVIATRADPALPLAHFRGKGMMLEIRTDDLRFTAQDAASLLKKLKTPSLSARDIAALNERTEGWAVGLKMAALSMRGQKDINTFIAAFTGSQRYVMDYLMEEVLQRQSQELRDFLMKTSVLERLTAPLCDVLTGRGDSEDILINLEREHLFIVPLDESRQWYRYEHLFADLLRHGFQTAEGKDQVAAMHRKASQWHEDNGFPDEAIRHALTAGDWQRAMRLMYSHGDALRKRGQFNTLLDWFQRIPQEVLRGDARLYSQYAALLASKGQLDAAVAALSYLEFAGQVDAALQGEIAFSRGLVCERGGDIERYLELSEKAFALLPPENVAMRGRAAQNIAHARLRLGPLEEVERWATVASELGQRAGDIWTVSSALGLIGNAAGYQGKLKRAVEMYKKAIEVGEQAAPSFGPHSLLCMMEYLMNDLEAASEDARLSVEQAEQRGDASGTTLAHFYQAQMCLARADPAGVAAAIERLDQASGLPSTDIAWNANYIACHVTYAIQQGNLEEAGRWATQLPNIDTMMPLDWHVPPRLLLAQGKMEAAAELLYVLHERLTRFGAHLIAARIRIYQALAADNEESALEFLSEALTVVGAAGAIRFFVDEAELLKPLLETALAKGVAPDLIRKLLDIIEDEERQKQANRRAANSLQTAGLLSEREIEVVRLLADDISNERIAQKLSVSLGTVKTHVHHIIDKLEVKDRRQAVQRARELGLL